MMLQYRSLVPLEQLEVPSRQELQDFVSLQTGRLDVEFSCDRLR